MTIKIEPTQWRMAIDLMSIAAACGDVQVVIHGATTSRWSSTFSRRPLRDATQSAGWRGSASVLAGPLQCLACYAMLRTDGLRAALLFCGPFVRGPGLIVPRRRAGGLGQMWLPCRASHGCSSAQGPQGPVLARIRRMRRGVGTVWAVGRAVKAASFECIWTSIVAL